MVNLLNGIQEMLMMEQYLLVTRIQFSYLSTTDLGGLVSKKCINEVIKDIVEILRDREVFGGESNCYFNVATAEYCKIK